MKRKLFSAILFGALLTASTSGLTSCKDYDDDISNLQSQIDKLATADQLSAKVSEMQAAIAAAQSAAEAKAAAAQTVADAAKAAAADAAAAASKAQGTADDAAKAAAAAAEVGKAAQAAVDKLAAEAATKAELEAAKDAAAAAVKAIQDAHATDKAAIEKAIADSKDELLKKINENAAALAALDTRLTAVEAQLKAIIDGEGGETSLDAIAAEVEAISDALADLIGAFTMATCVDLYNNMPNWDVDLKFWNVTEVESVFPTASQKPSSDADATVITDGKKFEFTAGKKNVSEDSLLVRVNPVDADLNAEGVSLKLVNSQGLEIPEDLVKVVEIKRYVDDAPMTKAADGNGLWIVKFKANEKLAEKEIKKQFEEYTKYNGEYVAFAIAIDQDFESAGVERRMVTSYNISLANDDAVHAAWPELSAISNTDSPVSIANLSNRFKTNDKELDVPKNVYGDDLKWRNVNPYKDGILLANTKVVTKDEDKDNYTVESDNRDNKGDKKSFFAKAGEKIRISFPAATPIKGFYVTLDWKRANESGTSEITAWNNYTYVNVAKMDPSTGKVMSTTKLQEGNNGYITIKSIAPNVNVGDIIGFRVFAVNLDGSLVDPDGQAFYVGIKGESITETAVDLGKTSATVTTTNGAKVNNAETNLSAAVDFSDVAALESFDGIEWACETGFKIASASAPTTYAQEGTDFEVFYYDEEGNKMDTGVPGFFFANVSTIKVHILNAQVFADGEEHNLVATLTQSVSKTESYTVGEAKLSLKKVMPTTLPAAYKLYKKPVGDFYMPAFATAASAPLTLTNFTLAPGEYDANGSFWSNDQTDTTLKNTFGGYFDGTDYTKLKGVDPAGWATIDMKNIIRFEDNKELGTTRTDLKIRVKGVVEDQRLEPNGPDKNLNPDDLDLIAANGYSDVIAGQYVRDNANRSIQGVYTYVGISLKKLNSTDAFYTAGGHEVAETVATLAFVPWSSQKEGFMSYKWRQIVKVQKKGSDVKNTTWMDNNEVVYAQDLTTPVTKSIDLNNIEVYFGARNNSLETTCGGTAYPKLANIIGTAGTNALKVVKVWTETNNGRPDEFFTASIAGNKINLRQIAIPQGNMAAVLCIEVVDVYSNHTVIRMPLSLVHTETVTYKKADSSNGTVTTPNGPNMINDNSTGTVDFKRPE